MPRNGAGGYHEGPEAGQRFDTLLSRLVSAPKDDLAKREAAWKKSRKAKKARSKKSHA
jgi:hypothetical protein